MESLQQPQWGEAATSADSKLQYIESAPADEVMLEQLEYLLLHGRSGRHAQCSDCVRLQKISRHLLSPFC